MPFIHRLILPIEPGKKELGLTNKNSFIQFYQNFDWEELLKLCPGPFSDDVINTPGIQVENADWNEALSVVNTGVPGQNTFAIVYKRPAYKRYFFGLFRRWEPNCQTTKHIKDTGEILPLIQQFFDHQLKTI